MEEITKIDENQIVKQSNRLIEARYNLTKYEQRMMIAICSQLDKNAADFEKVRINVADMAKFCNFDTTKGYSHVKNTIMRLLTRTLQIKHADGGWYATHWLQSAKYIPSKSVIEYKVDGELKPELLQLKAAYLSTAAAPLMEFRRDYSARMYFILKKMLKIRDFTYDLDFFRDRFQLSKSYNLVSHLKNKVLEPALAEINEKSDINVEHTYIKEGRSYKKIHFIVTLKDNMEPPLGTDELPLAPAQKENQLSESLQEVADKLIRRGVAADTAEKFARKYGADRINRNLSAAVKQKDSSTNLPGLIVSFIKKDTAGANAKAQAELQEREQKRHADARQAYEQVHGKIEIDGDYGQPVVIKDGKIISQ